MRPLKKMFHIDQDEYKKEYEKRYNDPNTIHLDISIKGNPAFFCQTIEMYQQLLSIEKTDKKINKLCYNLPGVALDQFERNCLVDEIVLSNNIEGVNSTRKEIRNILNDIQKKDKHRRFVGLVKKYIALMTHEKISIQNTKDIRRIYDDIFYEEIKATDPDNLPDGKTFRKNEVSVYSSSGEEIHHGIVPESKIISTMSKAIEFLNDDSINSLMRIAIFHYLFGYIHPFYDGNGRTSRFISSYCLTQELNYLIGYRISYTIKEHISEYYKAFDICNSILNKGDLSPFVEMFLGIIEISEKQLYQSLLEKKTAMDYYLNKIKDLPNSEDNNIAYLYELLIEAYLFSDVGISTKELQDCTRSTYNTLMGRLKKIPVNLIIKNKPSQECYYKLNLEEIDKRC